jgi:translation elongation factor EF-G|tara:strand:- start:17707 stop:18126 length:420 start_codon:yes stop_codon:yes gene_type:complete
MARKEEDKIKPIPPIGRFGGARVLQRRIGRSETLAQNKEVVAAELIAIGTAKITDIIDIHTGQVKPIEEIPPEALAAIKKVTVGQYGTTIEMFDKVGPLRVLAKASGLLDVESNVDKPSIIGINMKGPDIVTTYEAEDE